MLDIPKMDPVFKAEWVAALRSGRYKQGQKALRVHDSFCCMGVLCDIVKDHPEVSGKWLSDGFKVPDSVNNGSWPDRKVKELTGLVWGIDHLATMNDNGKSFAEIADYIEEHY